MSATQCCTVIGGGLAGCEAAWQLAVRGVPVRLYEMRPSAQAPAHHTAALAELVCSNSFKSCDVSSASGSLKRELTQMHSLLLACAYATRVAAGGALAVDRDRFSALVTSVLESHPSVEVVREECVGMPVSGDVIVATGPLTSSALADSLSQLVGADRLAFFDAAAPIVETATVDMASAFLASRYGKGQSSDYINCPLDRPTYERFVSELVTAERVQEKGFDRRELFGACQPIEEVARTGVDAVRFGAMKPVGLTDPHTGQRPWAVLQLRSENAAQTAHNLVGCQTNLTFPEQRRVFGLIPALKNANFLRYGVMHRNTFIDAPRLLDPTFALRLDPRIRVTGQLSGTEGYLEAVAGGLFAALALVAHRTGLTPPLAPPASAFGALVAYATDPGTSPYQPMHVNWGLVPPLAERVRGKRLRYEAYAARASAAMTEFAEVHRALLAPAATALGELDLSGGGIA